MSLVCSLRPQRKLIKELKLQITWREKSEKKNIDNCEWKLVCKSSRVIIIIIIGYPAAYRT